MTKIGRNQPCPCGSGRKYKNCCASLADARKQEDQGTVTFISKAAGLPGHYQDIVLAHKSGDPDDPRNQAPDVGWPGEYCVTFTFCRPGFSLLPEYKVNSSDKLEGDSHLGITKPAPVLPGQSHATTVPVDCEFEGEDFAFTAYPNRRGFLSKVVFESVKGDNFRSVEQKCYRVLMPFLSNWSVHLDVPLYVYQIDGVELKTGNHHVNFLNSFIEVPFVVSAVPDLSVEFRGFASIYREAMNSNSQVYQFLKTTEFSLI